MTYCYIKYIVFLTFFCYINLNHSYKCIVVPYKYIYNANKIKIDFEVVDSLHYYNPVDADWKRKKCSSLGFTYKEPNTKHEFTPYTVPVEFHYTKIAMALILSELICGDRNLIYHFARNIVNNLKSNEDIEKLFETKEMFKNYIAKTTKAETLNEETECPICYDSKYPTYYFSGCTHRVCYICADKLIIKRNYYCPFCRTYYDGFYENKEIALSWWDTLEILAAAYYLNACIYIYDYRLDNWILYRNYSTKFDYKNEKCVYLYKTEYNMGVVTNLTSS
ncbi:uncharacterized protein LOC126896878 isoform X2 [Daktulosphaira vitifoliae]|uniref:uncharacterized protein LOC126896878 isoform X2 n=1 Tax=Daktulosphaira vitifoliae TaxID=58002 RepID=UPI0021A9B962|nr:uncharacterized protein LOC126896878 isoform X2 [Daktulosphaira vitifoliae]